MGRMVEWEPPEAQQTRPAADRPPRRLRWVARVALVVVLLIVADVAIDMADRFSETVIFPRHVDPAWVSATDLAAGPADSWLGDVASDGRSLYIETREGIQGFWGSIVVRRSDDGGTTWSPGTTISNRPGPNAARHALAISPEGTLYAAWAEQGPQTAAQRLLVRRSVDRGASWSPPVRVSPPKVGLVALPVFLLGQDVRLIGYTDGQTGDIWIQRLAIDGSPDGIPAHLGVTNQQLYSDADFIDGGLALAEANGRILAAYVGAGRPSLRVAISDDGGRSWQSAGSIDQTLIAGQRPRLASDGATIVLAAVDPNESARYVKSPFVRVWRTFDGGASFQRGPDVTDLRSVGDVDVVWSAGVWRLVYAGCPGFMTCATPSRVWYAISRDGERWSQPSVVTEPGQVRPVGVGAGTFGVCLVWAEVRGDHDWRFVTSRRGSDGQ
jgi:hypothetical protein